MLLLSEGSIHLEGNLCRRIGVASVESCLVVLLLLWVLILSNWFWHKLMINVLRELRGMYLLHLIKSEEVRPLIWIEASF